MKDSRLNVELSALRRYLLYTILFLLAIFVSFVYFDTYTYYPAPGQAGGCALKVPRFFEGSRHPATSMFFGFLATVIVCPDAHLNPAS